MDAAIRAAPLPIALVSQLAVISPPRDVILRAVNAGRAQTSRAAIIAVGFDRWSRRGEWSGRSASPPPLVATREKIYRKSEKRLANWSWFVLLTKPATQTGDFR
ncbi:MAG: hypothetical protein WB678_06665 [Stellaceae bacterium]